MRLTSTLQRCQHNRNSVTNIHKLSPTIFQQHHCYPLNLNKEGLVNISKSLSDKVILPGAILALAFIARTENYKNVKLCR